MFNKIKEKISGNWIFFISSLLLTLILILVFPAYFNHFLTSFIKLFQSIVPIFLLVFAFIFIFDLIFSPQKILAIFGKKSGVLGWVFAIVLGIISSGPIYMWYPLINELKKNGMSDSLAMVFLYNRAIKIPLMPMIIFYFGLPFLIIMSIFMIIFSIINGYVGEKILIKLKGNK